jgi:hypothetical protein
MLRVTTQRIARVSIGLPGALAIGVSVLGLVLRVEHALTFDGPGRGADYGAHMAGVRWMLEHWRPFDLDPTAHHQIRGYPPLWYALSAAILWVTGSERAIASLAIAGWVMRQAVLAMLLRKAVPEYPWSRVAALSLHAVLPLSVLVDGKVNPEGLHAGLFAVALYALWRMERQAGQSGAIRWQTAAVFGIFTGLALLTKATAAVLIVVAAAVVSAHVTHSLLRADWTSTRRLLLQPVLAAAVAWCLVAGWWCGPNLVKHSHPFPHVWDLQPPQRQELLQPVLYRRPLGWALPFEWRGYWQRPIVRSPYEPRPNFWASTVSGTWSDYYNRGFCRLRGGEMTDQVGGGKGGYFSDGTERWSVTRRCVDRFATLLHVGVWVTLGSLVALFYTAWRSVRTGLREGSLVLPMAAVLCTLFSMSFALVYPFDSDAVINPRYLLSQALPMAACLGFALARVEGLQRNGGRAGAAAGVVMAAALAAIGSIAALLLYIRLAR